MVNVVGFVVIMVCVFGSFIWSGGKVGIVVEALPHEMVAIAGASLGAFLVSNSLDTVKQAGVGIKRAFKSGKWKKESYNELLSLLFALAHTFRTGGAVAMEPHLEDPANSAIFQRFPTVAADHHLVEFICDYFRMMTLSFEDPYQLSDAMDEDIDKHHAEELRPQFALQTMADGLPAIGIVAAVLGVIKTMSSINQPTEILGAMIGGALVGTFLGVLLSYCFVGPLASKLHQVIEDDAKPFKIAKIAMIAHAQGQPPQIAAEIARRAAPSQFAPSFLELEAALDELKSSLAVAR